MSNPMRGRYSLTDPAGARRNLFGDPNGSVPEPNAEIAPGTEVLAGGRSAEGQIRAAVLYWGIPSERPDSAGLVASARAESVARNPSFKESFQRRRCLIAADAFYEWGMPEEGPQIVWKFRASDDGYLAFAGIYQPLRSANGEGPATGCVVVTTAANGLVGRVHDRMPAIIGRADFDAWLNPDTSREDLQKLLRPVSEAALQAEELAPVA